LGNYFVPENVNLNVCIDIGGNCGSFSLKYANVFNKIYVYEALPSCYNICKNRLSNFANIYVYNEAVHKEDNLSVTMIAHINYDSGSSAVSSDIIHVQEWTSDTIAKNIKTISLETILSRLNNEDIDYVDYMKIDCETSEYNFLYNKDLSKIKRMAIEVHHQIGIDHWNELIDHILIYFDNVHNYNLSYISGFNKELYFESKSLI